MPSGVRLPFQAEVLYFYTGWSSCGGGVRPVPSQKQGGGMVADLTVSGFHAEMPRWGQLGTGIAKLLMRRPRMADVCRYIVLSVPWPEPPNGSVMLRCQDDGYLEVLGWFGYPKEIVDAYRRLSLFDDLPLTTAARTRQTVALYGSGQLVSSYPELVKEITSTAPQTPGALVAVPMVSDLGPIGVLGVSFPRDLDPSGPTVPALESIAPLLGLYIELSTGAATAPSRGPSPVSADSDDADYVPTPGPEGLTKRQLRVLGMLGKKMSNREIALALDYSVSTIRLDTMSIFRYLGVQSRREAVDEARRRGILPPS